MIHAIAADEALKRRRTVHSLGTGHVHWSTDFLSLRSTEIKDEPQALLIEMNADEVILPHFHPVDQFQIFIAGSGKLGRKDAAAIMLQYTDHHVAYGPITAGAQGLSFFALRRLTDSGPVYMDKPGYREKLVPSPKRSHEIGPLPLSTELVLKARTQVALEPLFEENYDDGLAAYVLRIGGGMTTTAPAPHSGGGQHYLVLNGAMDIGGKSYGPWSTIFVDCAECAPLVSGGDKGAEVLIMQFARGRT